MIPKHLQLPYLNSDVVCVGIMKKPTATVKHVGSHSITISITPPADAVQSAVIKYLIAYGKKGETRTRTTTESSVTLDNLERNTEYLIGVRAKYTGGNYGEYGPESDPLKVTTKSGIQFKTHTRCVVL